MEYKNLCKFNSLPVIDSLAISCFVFEADPEVMARNVILEGSRAILVSRGTGEFLFGNVTIPFSAGSLVFGFDKERFTVKCNGEVAYMYICFDGGRADELFRRFDIKSSNRSFDGFDGLIPLWDESLFRASEKTTDLAAEGILLYTFSRLSGDAAQRNSLVNKVIEIIEDEFSEPDLSLNTVAEMLSYNPKYISHVFKEKMKISFSEYLRSLRIKFAVSLFDSGLDSVKNVAILSGFSDPLYFSSVFKKIVGVSPKEYKNSRSVSNKE